MATSVVERVLMMTAERVVPFEVFFEITYVCNERCRHCYLVDYSARGQLTTDEVLRALDEIAEAGCLYLTLSGGEVLARRDFWPIARRARDLAFAVRVFSNATLVDRAAAEQFAELAVLSVEVSVYSSTAPIHDEITRRSGSFDRTIDGIRNLVAAGVRVVMKTPLMNANVHQYQEVIALADDLGAGLRFDPLIVPKDDGNRSPLDLRLNRDQLKMVLGDERLSPKVDLGEDGAGPRCGAGINSASISPRGIVRPCIQMPIDAGNLREQSFGEIWRHSPTFQYLRSLQDGDIDGCRSCGVKRYCNRCPGVAMLEDGNLLGPSQAACTMAEVKSELDGRPARSPIPLMGKKISQSRAPCGPK